MTMLVHEIERLRTVLATTEVAHDNSRADYKAANTRTETVKKELDATKTASENKDKTIQDLKAQAAIDDAEEKAVQKEMRKLSAELMAATASKAELLIKLVKAVKDADKDHAKWEKEQQLHFADHDALEKQCKLLDAEREAKKVAQNELVNVNTELRSAHVEIEAKNKTIAGLRSDLVGLRTQVEDSKKKSAELQTRLTETTTKLTGFEQSVVDAKKVVATLGAEALAAKEHIHRIDQELKNADAEIAIVKDQVKTLTIEKDDATTTVNKTQAALDASTKEITGLRLDLHTAKTAVEGLSSMLKECEAELKTKHDAWTVAGTDRDVADKEKEDAIRDLRVAQDKLFEEEKKHRIERLAYANAKIITPEQLKANEAKTMELEAKLAAAEKRLIPTLDPKNINILSLEYGGRAYTNSNGSNVLASLYKHATEGSKVKIENKLFDGGDPFQHFKKTFSITYQLADGGAPIHLAGHENDVVAFKLSRN
jgi:chromosome segregation ATPase